MCSAPKCQMRFTHANRHCPEHPYDQLKRCEGYVVQAVTEMNFEVIKWLEKYRMEKEDRTPTRKTPKRTKTSHSDDISMRTTSDRSNENQMPTSGSDENLFPVTPNNPYKSRKGLMVELDMNAGLGASPLTGTKMKPTPKVIRWHDPHSQEEDSGDEFEMAAQSAFNPKKRWLREAWQNDLARPLEPLSLNGQSFDKFSDKQSTPYRVVSPAKQPFAPHQRSYNDKNQMNPNQLRPTVLMVASKDRAMPLVNHPANDSLLATKNLDASQHATSTSRPALVPKSISPSKPVSNERFDLQTNGIDLNAGHTSSPAATNDGSNRKWLGALALMELATDDKNQVSSALPLVYEPTTN